MQSSLLPGVRARDLGIRIGALEPGPLDAITDVVGIRVGHATLIEGTEVRTGVTVVVPPELPLFAGCHRLNGNGELTGLEWVRESGFLTTPIAITNTFSVGVVRDALAAESADDDAWALPVVGETYDGFLNDAKGQHVTAGHTRRALAEAAAGPVAEGNVGGGTGMICHGFKGGIGTASRKAGDHVVGVLVQANHGRRARFRVNGIPVRERIGDRIPTPNYDDTGSIIGIVGTDAPLLPHQCDRLAQRAGLGVARMGGLGENSSGDLFFAFSCGNRALGRTDATLVVSMLPNERIDPLFEAVVDATEEAILNALLAAETMTGRAGHTAFALDPDALLETLATRA
jgi:D-aminopeptidase